jgi:hypothetical protein
MARRKTKKQLSAIGEMLDTILDLRYFHPDKEIDGQVAIPYLWDKGDIPLVLVLGENAGGKSFFRRLVQAVRQTDYEDSIKECIHLSMENRAGGSMTASPIVRSLIYGDEQYHATGDLTANTVTTGIKTARGRDHDLLMYWDEPDIGMSAASAAGAGVAIRKFVDTLPAHVKGVFVTSHSPALIHQLLQVKGKPHYIHLGVAADAPPTAESWVKHHADPFKVVPRLPEVISKEGHRRFKLIQALLPKRH